MLERRRSLSKKELIDFAKTEKRILLTNDKDFGELIFLQKKLSHGIILLRIKGQKTDLKVKMIEKLMENYIHKLKGHFVVVTRDKFRFIPLEDKR